MVLFIMILMIFMRATHCDLCDKQFKNTKDRHLDHCHETGHFRKIVCNMCNNYDNYLRFPDGIPSKSERDKKCRDKNKDKYYAKAREKYTCECGCIIGRGKKARHKKTMKHAQLMEQLN